MALPPPDPSSTALVTGASAGIGREIARGLARRGHGVTLVARRADRLEALADELRRDHGVRAEVIAADLAKGDECERLVEEVAVRELTVEVLVNNAGFGIYGTFGSAGLDREFEQLMVLIGAVVDLNGRVLPGMLERGRGAILNVSSTAGLQPLPGNGTYAACKSFVLFHSEALSVEARPHGVTVTAVCPGPVRTEFQETSSPLFGDRLPGFVWRGPERVAEDALRAVERGRRTVIPGGFAVRAFFAANRYIPSAITLPVSRRLMGKELERRALPAGETRGEG
jgi:short-subunit dehydrogenase